MKVTSDKNVNILNPNSDRQTDRNSYRNKINSLENIDEDHHTLSERLNQTKETNNNINNPKNTNNNLVTSPNKEINDIDQKSDTNTDLINMNTNNNNNNEKACKYLVKDAGLGMPN